MDVFDAERPRTSEEENAELKRLLAEVLLDSAPSGAIGSRTMASALKDLLAPKWRCGHCPPSLRRRWTQAPGGKPSPIRGRRTR